MAEQEVNVGMLGFAFMGKAHTFGYMNCNRMLSPSLKARLKCITGVGEEQIKEAQQRLGWEDYEVDWHDVIERDDIDLVDICTPNFVHKEQAIAAAEAGKDILCEKPLANNAEDAKEMLQAVRNNGVKAMCGFTYRQAPAVKLAREMIESGELGEIRHIRADYLQDFIMDPEFPMMWRLRKEQAGSGALGDLGAHITDIARFLVGEVEEVSGTLETFIKERPTGDGGTEEVTVDDAAIWCARMDNGALGKFEATRFAGGRKNYHTWEINGSKGSIAWNFENMNYLKYWKAGEGSRQGFRTIPATQEEVPGAQGWWPGGHLLGYGECHANQIRELMKALENDEQPVPTFEDGVQCQAVLDAVVESSKTREWTQVEQI